jgi:hypothetical protein
MNALRDAKNAYVQFVEATRAYNKITKMTFIHDSVRIDYAMKRIKACENYYNLVLLARKIYNEENVRQMLSVVYQVYINEVNNVKSLNKKHDRIIEDLHNEFETALMLFKEKRDELISKGYKINPDLKELVYIDEIQEKIAAVIGHDEQFNMAMKRLNDASEIYQILLNDAVMLYPSIMA